MLQAEIEPAAAMIVIQEGCGSAVDPFDSKPPNDLPLPAPPPPNPIEVIPSIYDNFLPSRYHNNIPIFTPTIEQFNSFHFLMKVIEPFGAKAGLAKVIPPKEWKDALPKLTNLLPSISIKSSITQSIEGGRLPPGAYTVTNLESRSSNTVQQWYDRCQKEKAPPKSTDGEKMKLTFEKKGPKIMDPNRKRRRKKSSIGNNSTDLEVSQPPGIMSDLMFDDSLKHESNQLPDSNICNIENSKISTSNHQSSMVDLMSSDVVDMMDYVFSNENSTCTFIENSDYSMALSLPTSPHNLDKDKENSFNSCNEEDLIGDEANNITNTVDIVTGGGAVKLVALKDVFESEPMLNEGFFENSTVAEMNENSIPIEIELNSETPVESITTSLINNLVDGLDQTIKVPDVPAKPKKEPRDYWIPKAPPEPIKFNPYNTGVDIFKDQGYCDELELFYWRNLVYKASSYGADLLGSLFEKSKSGKGWNLNRLDNLLNKVDFPLPGVNLPYLYFGMWKSTFAWHVEDMDLFSINYIHFGAPKQWYVIPPESAKKFESFATSLFSDDARACREFLRHKAYIISPKLLKRHDIEVNKTLHYEGEFMITYPKGYHQGYNLGFNCAESVNFALESWLEIGKQAKFCSCIGDSVKLDVKGLFEGVDARAPNIKHKLEGMEGVYDAPKLFGRSRKVMAPMPPFVKADRVPRIVVPKASRVLASFKIKKGNGSNSSLDSLSVVIKDVVFRPIGPHCAFCPDLTGSLLCTDTIGKLGHVLCAKGIPELRFEPSEEDPEKGSIVGFEAVPKARWSLKCDVCKGSGCLSKSKHGACIQCIKGKCKRAFHVTCAKNAGYSFKINEETNIAECFCPQHDPLKNDKRKDQKEKEIEQYAIKYYSGGIKAICKFGNFTYEGTIETVDPETKSCKVYMDPESVDVPWRDMKLLDESIVVLEPVKTINKPRIIYKKAKKNPVKPKFPNFLPPSSNNYFNLPNNAQQQQGQSFQYRPVMQPPLNGNILFDSSFTPRPNGQHQMIWNPIIQHPVANYSRPPLWNPVQKPVSNYSRPPLWNPPTTQQQQTGSSQYIRPPLWTASPQISNYTTILAQNRPPQTVWNPVQKQIGNVGEMQMNSQSATACLPNFNYESVFKMQQGRGSEVVGDAVDGSAGEVGFDVGK